MCEGKAGADLVRKLVPASRKKADGGGLSLRGAVGMEKAGGIVGLRSGKALGPWGLMGQWRRE